MKPKCRYEQHACRLLQPGGMFVGISYGSPKSRLPCFLNGEFDWVPVLYTMERPDSASPPAKGLAETKPILISGPYQPKVSTLQNRQ